MGLFDFLKPKQKPEDETYTPIIPPDQEVYLIDLDDTVKPEEIYRPDTPRPEPVDVPHISLTYEEAIAQGWHFKRKSRRRIRITRYTGTEKNVIIPSEIDGHMVNELGKKAFMQTEIDSVMLPVTLRKIADGCFHSSKLQRAVFEDGITKVPDFLFSYCEHLKSVRLSEQLYRIGNSAFYGCKSLRYISITNARRLLGVQIGDRAFEYSGLEGYAIHPVTYAWMNGTVFQNTPMQKKYKLILSPERTDEITYKVLLVGTEVHERILQGCSVKFPKDSFVSLGENSLSQSCFLDLSQCGAFSIHGRALPYTIFSNGRIWFPMECAIRVPQGYRGDWFPKKLRASFPEGKLYNCETGIEKPDADTAVLTLYGNRIHSLSVTCRERNVIIRMKADWTKFDQNAIISKTLEHLKLENLYSGTGELFDPSCRSLHCVEWNGITAYIPSVDLVGEWCHERLLPVFCGWNSGGLYHFFDSGVIHTVFTDESRKARLTQRQHILLAVDVLRSTESFFSDRTPYIRYLQTHKRYAMLLCRDMPEEYAGFLRSFYAVRT